MTYEIFVVKSAGKTRVEDSMNFFAVHVVHRFQKKRHIITYEYGNGSIYAESDRAAQFQRTNR